MRKRGAGSRKGSGSFTNPKEFAFRLENADFETLDAIGDRRRISTGALLREILRAYLSNRGA